ncbi:MAG: ATP-binding protein [Acidimicrobiia bacterium]|jgi:type IV secretory pathway VirB4 component|nr:ATP-binding protein [Acidimicrobiia bacterium]
MTRPSLRVRYHQGTTAHVSSIYPFSVQGSFGHRGTYVGLDLLAGGGEFCWDPFEAYATGLVTNPNGWILGEPGNGKSALVKCLLWRQAAIYGTGPGGRWTAIADPKGEYATLAEHLGLTVVKLSPGGTATINPLAPGPAADHEPADKQILRRAEMCTALVGTVLERSLTQLEDAVVFAAVDQLTTAPLDEPTLTDVARLVANPTEAMAERLRSTDRDLAVDTATVAYALDKLLSRSLRGMFDGTSTVPLRWDGPGVVLDLSAVPLDSDALPLVMVAAAGWFQQLMACPGPQRVQILDEAWALLGNRHTAGYLQTSFKLGRTYGVANLCITHRASDLVAQADDGTATSKIAAGLLADSATKIILRQAPDQLDAAVAHFGLSAPEASIVGQLTRGRALWKLGGRTAVVQHVLGSGEQPIVDTDARMHGTTATAERTEAA